MAGRNAQVFDGRRRIKPLQPAARGLDQVRRKALAEKDRLGLWAFPALDRHAVRRASFDEM